MNSTKNMMPSRSRFVTTGKNIITAHVNNQISDPTEVVNVKSAIGSIEVSVFDLVV